MKEVLKEHWDDYQLILISPEIGGNRRFFDYLEDYNLHNTKEITLEKRYKSDAVRYYAKRLLAIADGRKFDEKPPAKDWDERFTRAKAAMTDWVSTSEKKNDEVRDKEVDKEIEKSDWKAKLKKTFTFSKTQKNEPKQVVGAIGDALAASTIENPLLVSSKEASSGGDTPSSVIKSSSNSEEENR